MAFVCAFGTNRQLVWNLGDVTLGTGSLAAEAAEAAVVDSADGEEEEDGAGVMEAGVYEALFVAVAVVVSGVSSDDVVGANDEAVVQTPSGVASAGVLAFGVVLVAVVVSVTSGDDLAAGLIASASATWNAGRAVVTGPEP